MLTNASIYMYVLLYKLIEGLSSLIDAEMSTKSTNIVPT